MKVESSKVWMKKKYIDESKSIGEIAKEAKCSISTIRRRLKEFGLID